MQEWKTAIVNGREIPVLVSDEKEALLAAKAAGRAVVGLWRPGQEMEEIAAARYVVEDPEDVTEEYLERVARRHLGIPWHICETERLLIREMFADDFDEVWSNRIGRGFGSIEELEAYTKNQYTFYEFGFWALVEKQTGNLVGMAGLTLPGESSEEGYGENLESYALCAESQAEQTEGETLEIGYHVFPAYRRRGYAKEACSAIIQYGIEELGASKITARIAKENIRSKNLAKELGLKEELC
ncbi:MAG: GNAT family N-acetyltransferase [Lachnoclostridium sp.]|nr:GNAT family N-acetyltransferase [Lachnoclostridium sp.]